MHLADGLLSAPIYLGGYAIAGLTTWYCLRKIDRQPDPRAGIPKASLLTAAFFVASGIHIPLPPTSVHLVLNGLLGTVLGYYAFPAIAIGLFFQAVMFGHGGLASLGINALMMGIPALLAYQIFQGRRWLLKQGDRRWVIGLFAFFAGAVGLGLAVVLFALIAILALPANLDSATEQAAIYAIAIAHIPLMALEGIFTTLLVLFLQRAKPELLEIGPRS